jgi:hypothetical protein
MEDVPTAREPDSRPSSAPPGGPRCASYWWYPRRHRTRREGAGSVHEKIAWLV